MDPFSPRRFGRSFKAEISNHHAHDTPNGQRRYTHSFIKILKLEAKMCFKHVKEHPSRMMECQSAVDCVDGNVDHILKSSEESNHAQTCQFDICGNYRCMCEICTDEAERNAQNYRISRLKTENEKFKASMICRNCDSKSVEILTLPCSHIVCCEKCADLLDNCPLCDERILGTVRIYMG